MTNRRRPAWVWVGSAIAALLTVGEGVAAAQECPVGMTCFYVPPAMVSPGSPGTVESELWLSVPSGDATGTYRIDGGSELSFSVDSTAALEIPLGAEAMSGGVNVPETRGVFVVSSREDLLVEHKQSLFDGTVYTEGYSETVSRHTVALGTRFRLGGFRMTQASPYTHATTSQYATVVAPTGATVTLTAPPGATLPYWTGSTTETHTLTLAAGESATVAASSALDGALLTATAPVSVAAGGRGWLSPCGDNGSDLLVPTAQYGTQFGVRLPTGSAAAGSDVSVIADVDGTEVRVDGTLVATLGAGESHAFAPTSPAHIETSEPALVWMNGGLGCEIDTALIPPLELPALPLAITFHSSFEGEVAVVIPTPEILSLTLDGVTATPVSSTPLTAGDELRILVYTIDAGLHTMAADHGFQLLATSEGAGAGILAYFGPFISCTEDVHCADLGPCTIEECISDACASTPVEAGMAGECEDGLVCSGAGACVGVDAGVPMEDGGVPMEDGGVDAGPGDAGGAGLDGGGPPDTGSRVVDDAGCGCSLARPARPSAAWALLVGVVVARRARRRRGLR